MSNTHLAVVKRVGRAHLMQPRESAGAYSFALAVADTMDALGNVGLAFEQDALEQWAEEERNAQ